MGQKDYLGQPKHMTESHTELKDRRWYKVMKHNMHSFWNECSQLSRYIHIEILGLPYLIEMGQGQYLTLSPLCVSASFGW